MRTLAMAVASVLALSTAVAAHVDPAGLGEGGTEVVETRSGDLQLAGCWQSVTHVLAMYDDEGNRTGVIQWNSVIYTC
ncbi:MAG: hypothetical protein RLO50_17015 [Azospirillaceae bacterium]